MLILCLGHFNGVKVFETCREIELRVLKCIYGKCSCIDTENIIV